MLPTACVLSLTSLEMIPMLADCCTAYDYRLVDRVICQQLAGATARDNVSHKETLLPRAERAEAGWSGQLSYPNQTSRTTQVPRTPPQSAWTLSLRSFSMSEEGGSSWSSRPCRHHLALLFALLASRTETGAEPAAREAHGLQPNSRHVPSRKSARESRKTRSDTVFRWALRDGIPSAKRGF